jgi:hypothetical protein
MCRRSLQYRTRTNFLSSSTLDSGKRRGGCGMFQENSSFHFDLLGDKNEMAKGRMELFIAYFTLPDRPAKRQEQSWIAQHYPYLYESLKSI